MTSEHERWLKLGGTDATARTGKICAKTLSDYQPRRPCQCLTVGGTSPRWHLRLEMALPVWLPDGRDAVGLRPQRAHFFVWPVFVWPVLTCVKQNDL